MKARRTYRFRLKPTPQQGQGLKRIAGACRAVYNWGLERRKEHYAQHHKTLPYTAQNLELTGLKNQPGMEWLKEADSQALQESLRDLDRAYVNFFEGRPDVQTVQGPTLWLPYSAAGKGRRRTGLLPEGGVDRASTVATRGRSNQIRQFQNGRRWSLARLSHSGVRPS
jgi:transposase